MLHRRKYRSLWMAWSSAANLLPHDLRPLVHSPDIWMGIQIWMGITDLNCVVHFTYSTSVLHSSAFISFLFHDRLGVAREHASQSDSTGQIVWTSFAQCHVCENHTFLGRLGRTGSRCHPPSEKTMLRTLIGVCSWSSGGHKTVFGPALMFSPSSTPQV